LFAGDKPLCWKCGVPSLAHAADREAQSIRCGKCDEDEFSAARACGFYAGALRESVVALKREPFVADRLGRLLLATQQKSPLDDANLIVPVPLHPEREHARGFNQAVLLARELARLSRLPVDEYCVERTIHTERHRAGMDAGARRLSVAGAFSVRRPDAIAGRKVLLVDDVFTTGATASACAGVLKTAGAGEVFVLTLARAQTYQ
jgi:ComF family protein